MDPQEEGVCVGMMSVGNDGLVFMGYTLVGFPLK